MSHTAVEKLRNIALVGHGHAGKTSLTSSLLFAAGMTSRYGSVDEGIAPTDFTDEEIRHKFSIQTSLAFANWRDHRVNILDTPGFGDFVHDADVALSVVELAGVVICGVSGAEVLTEKVCQFAERRGLPRIVIINKLDRERSSFERALGSAAATIGKGLVPVQLPIGKEADFKGVVDLVSLRAFHYSGVVGAAPTEGPVPPSMADQVAAARERLVESIAESDDRLIEKYLEGEELTDEEVRSGLRQAVRNGSFAPVLCCSATRGTGVHNLLTFLVEMAPSPAEGAPRQATDPATGDTMARTSTESEPFAAIVFKTIADPYTGQVSVFRVVSGTVVGDSTVLNTSTMSQERLSTLFRLQGKEHHGAPVIGPGDFGAVAKLKATHTGDTLCSQESRLVFPRPTYPAPLIFFAVVPKSRGDEEKINATLQRLMEEDPMLRYERDARTGDQLLKGAGQQHIDVTMEKLRNKFGVEAELHAPHVPYMETIKKSSKGVIYRHKKQSGGRGQFAEVHIDIMPLERGEGFQFEEALVGMNVPRNFVPAVEKGIRELLDEGVVAGYHVTDLKVRFYDGKSHDVDSSEMAFKIAARQAFKKGVMDGGPILLEPIMRAEILVPEDHMGDIMGDLTARRGRPLGMEPSGSLQAIKAEVPMAEMLTYASDLRSITGGRGTFGMEFDHYAEVPGSIAQKIIDASGKRHHDEE